MSGDSADARLRIDSEFSEFGWCRKVDAENAVSSLRKPTILTRTILDLEWTAPGDDGNLGTAKAYDIRYALFPLNESNWNSATRFNWPPITLKAGSYQIAVIQGLPSGVAHYFGIKTSDDAGNWSGLSNIVQDTPLEETAICGDVTADGQVTLGDVVALINYIFGAGAPPSPLIVGDTNCSGAVNLGDAVHLLSYFFGGGDPPCCMQ